MCVSGASTGHFCSLDQAFVPAGECLGERLLGSAVLGVTCLLTSSSQPRSSVPGVLERRRLFRQEVRQSLALMAINSLETSQPVFSSLNILDACHFPTGTLNVYGYFNLIYKLQFTTCVL